MSPHLVISKLPYIHVLLLRATTYFYNPNIAMQSPTPFWMRLNSHMLLDFLDSIHLCSVSWIEALICANHPYITTLHTILFRYSSASILSLNTIPSGTSYFSPYCHHLILSQNTFAISGHVCLVIFHFSRSVILSPHIILALSLHMIHHTMDTHLRIFASNALSLLMCHILLIHVRPNAV